MGEVDADHTTSLILPLITVVSTLTPAAVRFGRIPKREKQRMLLEMQNAMNNMMGGGGGVLLGQQGASPLPFETMALHTGSSPSSSSSSSSSSSCSSPSSPRCPQDSESVVSMDTNSSSASSCGSDSGEDEAVALGIAQRRESFAYGRQGSPVPVAAVTPVADGHMDVQQNGWSRWNKNHDNDNNVATEEHQHSSYGNSRPVTNTAYREEERVHYHHTFSAPSVSSGYSGPVNSLHNRAHLVSVWLIS